MTGQQPEDAYPVAYCAPGKRAEAERVLAERGHRVARIIEDPWLEESGDLYVAPAECLDLRKMLPLQFEFGQPEPELALSRFRETLRYGALVNRPTTLRLSSVI